MVLDFKDGFLRHQQGILYPVGKSNPAGGPMFQQFFGIWKTGPEGNGAGTLAEFPFYGFDFALLGIVASVGQNQPDDAIASGWVLLPGFDVFEVLVLRNVEVG